MSIPSNDLTNQRRLTVGVGDRVRVRQEHWVVTGVEPYDRCTVVTLSAAGAAAGAGERQVLAPFEDIEPDTRGSGGACRVGQREWSHVCRSLIEEHGPVGTLRVAPRARVDLLPYQLEPALALLRGHASRVLIADAVGLGKTVQAALAAAELRACGAAARVLVIAPAGLREQWVEECRTRFELPLTSCDQASLRRAMASWPIGINPWTLGAGVVTSVDYLKRPEVLPLVLASDWDVVIVDEAHGSSGASSRHEAVQAICRRAPYVLLLSATPHNGDEATFASLCALGDLGDRLVVFRRTRQEAGRDLGRRVHTLRVRQSPEERRMYDALAALTAAVLREGAERRQSNWLLLSLLHKRALSSPYALAASVERRLALLTDEHAPVGEQLPLPLLDAGEHDDADAVPMWGVPALTDPSQERRLLEDVVDAARLAVAHDSKLRRLQRLLRTLREPAVVFTEYRDTLIHLHHQVAPEAAVLHGGLGRAERRDALEAFGRGGLLLATDAAGEGLNLQQGCRTVINLELPWNPMRLEQRVGRVDRIGQKHRVHVFHLVAADSGEARLLDRLVARVTSAGERIGAPDPFLARPAWTETDAVRVVVGRADAPGPPPAQPSAAVPLTRFEDEAADACRRALLDRANLRDGAGGVVPRRPLPVGSPVFVGWSNRRRTRMNLRGRALVVFRTIVTDAWGRTVASHLTPLLVVMPANGDWLSAFSEIDVSRRPGWREWHDESTHTFERMSATALRRALALAAALSTRSEPAQRGLFDRRADRRWAELDGARAAALAAATLRVERNRATAGALVTGLELALVLLPCRPMKGRDCRV